MINLFYKFLATFVFLCGISIAVLAQEIDTHEVEPKGVYAEIKQEKEIKLFKQFADEKTADLTGIINQIEKEPDNYTPPALYLLSKALYQIGSYDDAAFWFYVAQLRARYDVNRCADKTANASNYNNTFGPDINHYALKDTAKLKLTIEKVIVYVSTHQENYDQRWINLSGMEAISVGMGKTSELKELSLPKEEWATIKKKTIKDYHDGFLNFLSQLPQSQKR